MLDADEAVELDADEAVGRPCVSGRPPLDGES